MNLVLSTFRNRSIPMAVSTSACFRSLARALAATALLVFAAAGADASGWRKMGQLKIHGTQIELAAVHGELSSAESFDFSNDFPPKLRVGVFQQHGIRLWLEGGEIQLKYLGGEWITYILKRLQEQAEVERFSPHDVRRTNVTRLADAGVDVFTVQCLAGHANASTTAQYDHRGDSAKRRLKALRFR